MQELAGRAIIYSEILKETLLGLHSGIKNKIGSLMHIKNQNQMEMEIAMAQAP
jgi:hypothetical protein